MTQKKKVRPAEARRFGKPTATYFAYSPDAGVIRVTVQHDGELGRTGKDVDLKVAELSPEIREDLENLLGVLADEAGVASFHD